MVVGESPATWEYGAWVEKLSVRLATMLLGSAQTHIKLESVSDFTFCLAANGVR